MSSRGAESTVSDDWPAKLREAIGGEGSPVHLVGVGNPIRSDDAVGLEVASRLRKHLRQNRSKGVKVHWASPMPERVLSRLSAEPGRIIIFDAVEASRPPGEIVCARLDETKYGFFATHNVPLRLVPGLEGRKDDVLLVGVQPSSLEVGEGLTDVARRAVDRIVAVVADMVGEKT